MASSDQPSESAAAVPKTELSVDLDEEELDDLDDLLDEFSTTNINTARPRQFDPQPSHIQDDGHDDLNLSETAVAEFNKQLEEQMAALMGSEDESPEMKRKIRMMMQGHVGLTDVEKASEKNLAAPPTDTLSSEQPFQETIRRTMERMQASGEKAETASTSEGPDDILAQMLREMQNGGTEDDSYEEGFSKMLMNMMEQLTDKEILYEPMKELHDKFPSWMREHESSVEEADLVRYREQERLVGEIVRKFDEMGYTDSDPDDREFIVERMHKMQAAGSPPDDLVGNMSATQDALREFDESCAPQ